MNSPSLQWRILRLINALNAGGKPTLSNIDIAEILREDYHVIDWELSRLCHGDDAFLELSGDRYYITRLGRDALDEAVENPTLIFNDFYRWIAEARSGITSGGKQSQIQKAAIPSGQLQRTYHERAGRLAFAAIKHGCTIQEMIDHITEGTLKRCPKCGESKMLEEYHKDSRQVDGHHAMCKVCRKG